METTPKAIVHHRTLPSLASLSAWLTWSRVAALLLTGIGLLLRRYHINTQSLWFDEADIVARAHADIGSLLVAFTSAGENGPLYTLLLHFWMRLFGESETAVRSLSALFGTLTIPLIYLFTSALLRAGGATHRWAEGVGVLAAAILTIAPFHIWYSQEAKMYALVVFATLGSMYAFVLALERDTPRRWVAYVIITLLALYAHGMAVLILLAQLVYYAWLLLTHRRTLANSRYWLRATLIMLLPFVPLLILRADYLLNTSSVSQFYPPTTLPDIIQAVIVTFSLNRLPDGMHGWELAGGALFTILVIAGLVTSWRTPSIPIPNPSQREGSLQDPSPAAGGWEGELAAQAEQRFAPTDNRTPIQILPQHSALSTHGPQSSTLSTPHAAAALLAAYLLVPIVGFWLITLRAPLFEPRYLIIALPAWLTLVAFGIAAPLKGVAERAATLPDLWRKLAITPEQRTAPHQGGISPNPTASTSITQNSKLKTQNSKLVAALAILLVAITSGSAMAGINFTTAPTKEDWRGAMLYVKTHMRAGDVIIVYPGYLLTAVDYYMQNGPGPADRPSVPAYGIEPRIVMSGTMRELNTTFSQIISNKRRAWLVQSPERVKLEDPRGSVKWWLDGNYIEDDAQFYNGVDVYGINFNGNVSSYYPRPQTLIAYTFNNGANGDKLDLLGYSYEPRNQPWLPPSPNSNTEQGRCTFAELDGGKCSAANLVTLTRADYFPLTLYWRVDNDPPKANYTVTLSYVDKSGKVIGSVAAQPLNGYLPTSKWAKVTTYIDYRDLWVAGDQPPDLYAIQVQVVTTTAPNQPLPATDSDGKNVGNAPTLTRIVNVKP